MTSPVSSQRTPFRDAYRLNAVQIPALRALGFGILIICVLLYKVLLDRSFTWTSYLQVASVIGLYCAGSWIALRWAYSRRRKVDFSQAFLIIDLFFMLYAVYHTGADNSLLFFVLVMRVSDQGYNGTRQMFIFAHLTTLAYGLFLVYLAYFEQ